MVVTPSRQNLVQPTGIEPVYLPFQGSTHPSKSKLHIINCHHGNRKSTPYRLEVKNPWLRHHLVLARHYLAGQSQNRDDDKIWSPWKDSNFRPHRPKRHTLTRLSYTEIILSRRSHPIQQNRILSVRVTVYCAPLNLAGDLGIEPSRWRVQSPSPSHLANPQLNWYSGRDSNPQGSFLL